MTATLLTSPIELKPSATRLIGSLLLLPAIVMTFQLGLLFQPAQASTAGPSYAEEQIINLTNQERTSRGLTELRYNARLSAAAEAKAIDMLNNGYFNHMAPSGRTPWQFIEDAGYHYVKAGENLAIDFQTIEAPVPAWMASPTHRANILKPAYKEVGIARVKGEFQGRETFVVVQMFGARALPF